MSYNILRDLDTRSDVTLNRRVQWVTELCDAGLTLSWDQSQDLLRAMEGIFEELIDELIDEARGEGYDSGYEEGTEAGFEAGREYEYDLSEDEVAQRISCAMEEHEDNLRGEFYAEVTELEQQIEELEDQIRELS